MFGWHLIHDRELLSQKHREFDLKEQILMLRKERDHERARAEASVQAVLAVKAGIVLKPKDMEGFDPNEGGKQLNIFDDDAPDKAIAQAMDTLLNGGIPHD